MQRAITLTKKNATDLLWFIKGVAILLIVFHHFGRSVFLTHGFEPTLLQWNFSLAGERADRLISDLFEGRYSEFILRVFCRFGYFGVHLFVLASGLGLALSTPETTGAGDFLKRRFRKLVPPFWTAVAFFVVLRLVVGQPFSVRDVFERTLLISTFDRYEFFKVDPPLWCLAVFFQLYLLFFPLRWLIARYGGLIVVALAAIAFVARWATSLPPILRWNPYFGHVFALNWLAVFGLGIWIGIRLKRDGELVVPGNALAVAILAGTSLLILSETFASVYPIHDTAIALVIGGITLLAWHMLFGTYLFRVFCKVGMVSFPLYLYHRPIVGMVVLFWSREAKTLWLPSLVVGILTVAGLILCLEWLVRALLRSDPKLARLALGV